MNKLAYFIVSRSAARLLLTAAAVALLAVPAVAQVDSRSLGTRWPVLMLPPYMMELPPPASMELEAPLLSDVLESSVVKPKDADAADILGIEKPDGDPEATTFDKLMDAPRDVISLARDGKFDQAIAKGKPLLNQPHTAYGDFTWDLLTTAVAWSQLQTGAYADCIVTWRQGGAKIRDLAVREYHMIAARTVDRYQKDSPDDLPKLKDPAALQMEVIKELREPVRQILRSLELTKTIRLFDGRLNNLAIAYDKLRLVMAVDRDTGEKLLRDYFRPAADTLFSEVSAVQLEAAKRQFQLLVQAERMPLKRSDIPAWNAEVTKLWAMVADVKRLSRIHNYLQRKELAGNFDHRSPFEAAHELLFAPGELRYVWQTTGRSTSSGFDMRRRTPSHETPSPTELREALERERRMRSMR